MYFVGKQTDLLPAFYKNAKLTVLPSTIETFGQVIIESMACGTPVLGFERDNSNNVLNAFAEIVEDGVNGVTMSSVSCESVKEKLDDFYNNSRSGFEQKCLNESLKYSWNHFINNLINN